MPVLQEPPFRFSECAHGTLEPHRKIFFLTLKPLWEAFPPPHELEVGDQNSDSDSFRAFLFQVLGGGPASHDGMLEGAASL